MLELIVVMSNAAILSHCEDNPYSIIILNVFPFC